MVRIGLSLGAVLVSLLFPSGRALAARMIYAYKTPCEAMGVGCAENASTTTPTQPVTNDGGGGGGRGDGPVYVPRPAEPLSVPEPVNSAPAPLPEVALVPSPVPYVPYIPEIPRATPVRAAAPLHPAGPGMEMSFLLVLISAGICIVRQKCSSHFCKRI